MKVKKQNTKLGNNAVLGKSIENPMEKVASKLSTPVKPSFRPTS